MDSGLLQCCNLLGVDSSASNLEELLDSVVKRYNEIEYPSHEETSSRIEILSEINLHKDLKIKFQGSCNYCEGRGFHLTFDFYTKPDTCPKCKGNGFRVGPCKTCSGEKKINGKDCTTCKGTGIYVYRKTFRQPGIICTTCNGNKEIQVIDYDHKKIKERKICKYCDGTGKYKMKLWQPVISKDIAEKLQNFARVK